MGKKGRTDLGSVSACWDFVAVEVGWIGSRARMEVFVVALWALLFEAGHSFLDFA
jgi:hypothetical protein